MPLFTRENAAEMQRRSTVIKLANNIAIPPAAKLPAHETELAEVERKKTLAQQIDLLDEDIAKAKNPMLRLKLIDAKAKLWALLYPKPGVLRPGKRTGSAPVIAPIEPLPVVNVAPIVSPETELNHNGENIQSQVLE